MVGQTPHRPDHRIVGLNADCCGEHPVKLGIVGVLFLQLPQEILGVVKATCCLKVQRFFRLGFDRFWIEGDQTVKERKNSVVVPCKGMRCNRLGQDGGFGGTQFKRAVDGRKPFVLIAKPCRQPGALEMDFGKIGCLQGQAIQQASRLRNVAPTGEGQSLVIGGFDSVEGIGLHRSLHLFRF